VFTGPFLDDDNPTMFGVKVPVEFWKVITFVHDETGELCATGYTMSQRNFLSEEESYSCARDCAAVDHLGRAASRALVRAARGTGSVRAAGGIAPHLTNVTQIQLFPRR
jgi:DNA/RNA endonuclease G (NUC1)